MLRREYKYLVPFKLLDELRAEFIPFVEIDDYSLIRNNNEYTVRSIYFDTHKLNYYYEKIEGLKNRKKLRVRGYNELTENSIVLLEIKKRINQFIDKNRSPVLYKNLDDIFISFDIDSYVIRKSDKDFEDAKRFFFHYNKSNLKPTCLVVYEREAYFSKFNHDIRITFDKNLRYKSFPSFPELYRDDILKPAVKDKFLLEMKFFRGFPEQFQKIINKFKLRRISFSKYSVCIEADNSFSQILKNNRYIFSKPVWPSQTFPKDAI